MSYLLDTSVLIAVRDAVRVIEDKVGMLEGPLQMSIISLVELEGGVYRTPAQTVARRLAVDLFVETFQVLEFGLDEARCYATLVSTAGYSRRKLIDRMIAAQAIVAKATLITLNGKDFSDLPSLTYLDWGQ